MLHCVYVTGFRVSRTIVLYHQPVMPLFDTEALVAFKVAVFFLFFFSSHGSKKYVDLRGDASLNVVFAERGPFDLRTHKHDQTDSHLDYSQCPLNPHKRT